MSPAPGHPAREADEDRVYAPPRHRAGGWIVAIVMLAAVSLLGVAVARRYQVVDLIARRASRQPQGDPRVESFLADAERAFADGDLDAAQRDFDKASVLTEKDPRVILGQARVAAAKADVPWLKIRLLPPDAIEDLRTAKAQLDDRVALARRAADEAVSVAPQDPRALLAELDALRLAGDVDAARGYVVAVFAHASQPETAYVLAALDLAQPGPPLSAVVDRLRLAAAADANAGRAEAALVYALARSGDTASARTELAKLDASARPYPLAPNLHAWIGSVPSPAAPVGPLSAPTSSDAPASALPQATGATTAAATESARSNATGALRAAGEAIGKGDFDRAERIYQGILASNPGESQALAGLGDVLRMRHDPQGAIDAYRRAIAMNPSYLPSALGLGDVQWAEGDHAAAAQSYKNVVDHFPEGTYPGYVVQRAAAAR